jgi:RimJ/RimL family protein N-acetyltransferase
VQLTDLSWPVRTQRLSLRPATVDDVEPTWLFRRLPDVASFITWEAPDLTAYRARFLEPERLAATLVVEHHGTVVGDLMLRIEDAWAQTEVAEQARGVQAELGWVLDPGYGGRGLATEAVRELLRLCFEELGLRRVTANCFADNTASWRLMERVGMRRETHAVADSLHRSGAWLDGFGYAMLAQEWRRTASSVVGGLD